MKLIIGLCLVSALCAGTRAAEVSMESVAVSEDGGGFVLAESGRAFAPWGLNYDHDGAGRLIEDYWEREWATVAEDFREMKELGANVVRVHLQFGKLMDAPDQPNEAALRRLGMLLALATKGCRFLLDRLAQTRDEAPEALHEMHRGHAMTGWQVVVAMAQRRLWHARHRPPVRDAFAGAGDTPDTS